MDARKPASDVTKIRSLDSEAWIPDAAKPRIDLAVLPRMWVSLQTWNARTRQAIGKEFVEIILMPLTLRISWICVVSTTRDFV